MITGWRKAEAAEIKGSAIFPFHCSADASVSFSVQVLSASSETHKLFIQMDEEEPVAWETGAESTDDWFESALSETYAVSAGVHSLVLLPRSLSSLSLSLARSLFLSPCPPPLSLTRSCRCAGILSG